MAPAGRVHLIGGGRDEDALAPLFAAFVDDARRGLVSGIPDICVLLVTLEDDDETEERFRRAVSRAGANADVHTIFEGDGFAADAVSGADGILVGGGLTPAYHAAFTAVGPRIRERVRAGVPYLGFSAGAAIAAERALIGGYRIDAIEVCDADAGEELDEVTVVPGLGLVPHTVDVHAAQWGTVSRLAAAAAAGLVESGVAIDEHTALTMDGAQAGAATARGRGAVWWVEAPQTGAPRVASLRRVIADR